MLKSIVLAFSFIAFSASTFGLTESNKQIGFLGLNADAVSVNLINQSNQGCFFNLLQLGDIDGPQAVLVNAWYALLLSAKTSGRSVTITYNVDPANPANCLISQISMD